MKVSRSSWHYKLISFLRNNKSEAWKYDMAEIPYQWEPVNSCAYFREVVLCLFFSVFIIAPLAILISPIWLTVMGIVRVVEMWPNKKTKQEKIEKEVAEILKEQQKREGLLKAYLEGRRGKFCSIVEYED